jgi:MFS transporter, MHS family, proline/betaine transporter
LWFSSYSQIGIASSLIDIVARLLQGFSTGGEFGAATAFMVEHADVRRRGFFASWQMSTQGLATVLAAGISALLGFAMDSGPRFPKAIPTSAPRR